MRRRSIWTEAHSRTIRGLRPALFLALVLGCGRPPLPPAAPATDPASPGIRTEETPTGEAPAEDRGPEVVITLAAVGDVLPHRRVKSTARALGWSAVFGDAIPILEGADVAFANLEGPIAPDHHQGIHGEVFNAPADLAPALSTAGIDVVSMANNHAFDQGPAGLIETWTRTQEAGLIAVGAGPDCASAAAPRLFEVRGVKVAFLAATDLMNLDRNAGPAAPCVAVSGPVCAGDCGPDRDAVHFSIDRDRLVAAVTEARKGADFVVMSFHWGIEYRSEPLPEYPILAAALVDAGVDVLLGHHPHVLQPVVIRDTPDGRRAVIAYSLGNFVSNMGEGFDPASDDPSRGLVRDGLVLEVPLLWRGPGRTEIGAPVGIPLWTENRPDRVTVRTLLSLSSDPASASLARSRWEQVARVVGTSVEPLP